MGGAKSPPAGGTSRWSGAGSAKRNLLKFVNKSPELAAILRSCRSYFGFALLFSLGINLLYLAGPLYMLQVYDRVMSSGSLLTLVMLTVARVLAYIALSSLDVVRARLLTRANIRLDQRVTELGRDDARHQVRAATRGQADHHADRLGRIVLSHRARGCDDGSGEREGSKQLSSEGGHGFSGGEGDDVQWYSMHVMR